MMVITQAIISTLFGVLGDKIVEKLDDIKPKDGLAVIVKQNPDTYSITELDKTTTTNQKWTIKDKPIMQFENPLVADTIVKEIAIIPDSNFKTLGKLLVTIDDIHVFQSKSFTSFEDVSETIIKINKTINRDSKVKLFMISLDGTAVGITAQITFGE